MTADSFVFNPYGPSFDADPGPVYRHLLEHAPVYWWERGQAFMLSKYADVLALMKDPRFSRSPRDGNNFQPIPNLPEYHDYRVVSENSLMNVGVEDHLRQRRLVNTAFSPRAVERLREHTREITRQALSTLSDAEVVNLAPVADYIPLRVIGRMLDIPASFEDSFLEFARARLQLVSPSLPAELRDPLMRTVASGYAELRTLIDARRQSPGDDLLSVLIHHEEDGQRLLENELLGLVGAIIIAGSDTTVHTLRFLLLDLLRHPEQLAQVRGDPKLARVAMEESLRFNIFSRFSGPCYALEDVTIRGVAIKKRQMVIPITGAGTRDPEVFERPEEFDIHRPDLDKARNFGLGPHTCLGVHLARVEIEEALPVILEHFPTMTLAGPPNSARTSCSACSASSPSACGRRPQPERRVSLASSTATTAKASAAAATEHRNGARISTTWRPASQTIRPAASAATALRGPPSFVVIAITNTTNSPPVPNADASSTRPCTLSAPSASKNATTPNTSTHTRDTRSLPRSLMPGRSGTTRLWAVSDAAASNALSTVERIAEMRAPTNAM